MYFKEFIDVNDKDGFRLRINVNDIKEYCCNGGAFSGMVMMSLYE